MTQLIIALCISGALVAGVFLLFLGLERGQAKPSTKENET